MIVQPVELALELALIVLRNGGATELAERTLRNVLHGLEQSRVTVAWRLDLVVARCETGGRFTYVRPVGEIGINLVRVSAAAVLGERVARGEVDGARLPSEIERVNALGPPYARWILIVIAACNAGAFSQTQGGGWGAFIVAFGAAGAGQFVRTGLLAKGFQLARVNLVAGVLSACLAAAGVRAGISETAPATLISSVIYMIPGLPLINGFFDMVSHKYLFIGFERIVNAAFLFLVLALSIAVAYAFVLSAGGTS